MQLHSLEVPEEYGGPGLSRRVDVAALMKKWLSQMQDLQQQFLPVD